MSSKFTNYMWLEIDRDFFNSSRNILSVDIKSKLDKNINYQMDSMVMNELRKQLKNEQ